MVGSASPAAAEEAAADEVGNHAGPANETPESASKTDLPSFCLLHTECPTRVHVAGTRHMHSSCSRSLPPHVAACLERLACPARLGWRSGGRYRGFMELDVDREALAEVCRRYGVAELAVFGSVARGESTSASDIDITYVLAPGRRLGWEIEDLSDELSTLFGRRVDLVSRRALHPRVSDRVVAESRVLYVA